LISFSVSVSPPWFSAVDRRAAAEMPPAVKKSGGA
jgi:hypothetical protein